MLQLSTKALHLCKCMSESTWKRTINAASVSDTLCPFLLDSMVISLMMFLITLSACLPAILLRLPWLWHQGIIVQHSFAIMELCRIQSS